MLMLKWISMADMPFRQALLGDADTMAYNAGYAPYAGYDATTGCIDFPEEEWTGWLADWTNHAPERFCALLHEDGVPVGEVNWHDFGREMGVVIHAKHRGHGYGRQGLRLLADEAFRYPEISQLMNAFEPEREAALSAHMAAGFVPVDEKDGLLRLRLTRERYESLNRRHLLRLCMDAMCAFDAGDPLRIQHFVKVHSFARQIGEAEQLDENTLFTLETAAILHDIGIHPALAAYGRCDGPLQEKLGPPEAETLLTALNYPQPVIRRVCFLIAHHHTVKDVAGADWQILLEADFLVNMVEESLSKEAIHSAEEKLFRTPEGKRLLQVHCA